MTNMMQRWGEVRKANFKWNQYVKLYIDGEQATDTVQVRDTEQYGGYLVEEMFGHNKVTRVMLVTPSFDPCPEPKSADEDADWEAQQDAEIKAELEAEIEHEREIIERFDDPTYRPDWKGNRREAMRRHHERKLANAQAFYDEAIEKGWFGEQQSSNEIENRRLKAFPFISDEETVAERWNRVCKELAVELKDAGFDEYKQRLAYLTSEESGYAMGCDLTKLMNDVAWEERCL